MRRNFLPSFVLLLFASTILFAGEKRGPGIGDVPPKNRMTFDQLDLNHDGKVTEEEFKTVEETAAQVRFKQFDTDRDGRISKSEFTATSDRKSGKEDQKAIERRLEQRSSAFTRYDKDQSGDLNRDEFDASMIDAADLRFDRVDLNKDNLITRDELDSASAGIQIAPRADHAKHGRVK